ncbi:hypothetical protein LguiB_007973 [Lonicera macranthoides]
MAFFSKAGSILRQTVSKHINQEISASKPSLFQMIRCMSSSKVFVGGLAYATDDTSLREAFNKYGEVIEARVIVDRETGRSRGFGFITYATPEDASSAIQALDGQDLHGRMVRVNYATDRPRDSGFGGGGGYGGGGYGGGGGGGSYGGSGGNYGGGGYGSGGGGDSYASGNSYGSGSNASYGSETQTAGYGTGNGGETYTSENSFGSGTGASYGSGRQNAGVAGGGDNYVSGGGVGGNFKDDVDEPSDYASGRG